jgi:hypothetical protein
LESGIFASKGNQAMNDITEDDLLRYAAGEIDDADELRRIEAALDSDPELADNWTSWKRPWPPIPRCWRDSADSSIC